MGSGSVGLAPSWKNMGRARIRFCVAAFQGSPVMRRIRLDRLVNCLIVIPGRYLAEARFPAAREDLDAQGLRLESKSANHAAFDAEHTGARTTVYS
jgi:hypothetical protein